MSNYEEIQNALSYIDAHDRETWFEVGAALKDELGEDGYALWDNWSQSADSYKSQDAKAVWKSIKPGHLHIASLFHHARAGGYRPSKPYVPPTAEEQARRAAEAQARQQAEERARAEKQTAVKTNAQKIWERAKPADLNHPYLAAKGITEATAISGLRQNPYKGDLNLLVPVMYEREVVNLQSINQDGGKRFLAGGQVKGGYAVVGDASKIDNGIVIAEGYATAASIHQATGKPVLVAFNAGNMVTVSERLAKSLPPDVPVVLAVDNDASQTGIKKAMQAAAYFGDRAQAIQPEFTMTQIQQYQREKGLDASGNPQLPSDFNDLHHLAGLGAVKNTFAGAFRPSEMIQVTEQRPEPPKAVDEMAQAIADEARLRGMEPPPATFKTTPTAAEQAAVSQQESAMSDNETVQTASVNSIEFDDSRNREPQPAQAVEAEHAAQAAEPAQTASKREPEAAARKPLPETEPRPVLDLNYKIPPDSIKSRYIVADGQYLSAKNGTTVLFEDSGKKISTAKTDNQTIQDMLEVAKAKGWDSIKLNGTKEFKQMMYVAAESQGIRTKGYAPTPADLALVERLRQDKSLNSIEQNPAYRPEVAAPVEPAVQTASAGGERTPPGQEAKPKAKPDDERKVRTQPDVAAIATSEKLMAQGSLPSEAQVNVSERADTDKNVPIKAIGGEEIHAEVKHHADDLKTNALDTGLVSAKQAYMQKAEKLSKPNRERLAFYERSTLDAIRGARDDVRTDALRNYYEHTAKHMSGSKLNLPNPVQIPGQSQSAAMQQRPERSQSQQQTRGMEEPEYGR